MIKLIGFESQSGNFTAENTGEVINWSNRLLRCVTDENLGQRERGLKIFEQKLKTDFVVSSLGINPSSSEDMIDNALAELIDKNISFTTGIVKGKLEVNGFVVLNTPVPSNTGSTKSGFKFK